MLGFLHFKCSRQVCFREPDGPSTATIIQQWAADKETKSGNSTNTKEEGIGCTVITVFTFNNASNIFSCSPGRQRKPRVC